VDKELEDDFDPRDFPAYFSDGTLDLIKKRDRNSGNLLFSDSDDEDDNTQDLGHLEHILRDGAPAGLSSWGCRELSRGGWSVEGGWKQYREPTRK